MTPTTLAILLLAGGVALLLVEMLLPTHGLLGIVGAAALVAAVFVSFREDRRLGLGLAVALVALAPFGAMLWVKVWPRTAVGKRMILAPVKSEPAAPPVRIGQSGVTVTELRPMGVCEFGDERFEARAERGTIGSGERVEVIALVDGRPTVRPLTSSAGVVT